VSNEPEMTEEQAANLYKDFPPPILVELDKIFNDLARLLNDKTNN